MAASTQSEVQANSAVEEINSAMDTNEDVHTDNDVVKAPTICEQEEKDTDYPFKKPAFLNNFSAPSLAIKRGAEPRRPVCETPNVNSEQLRPIVEEDIPRDQSALNTSPVKEQEGGDKASDKEPVVAPVKTKDAGPRVFPAKGPPAAKYKPHPPLPYTEPAWGGIAAESPYQIEILKNGAIVDTVPLAHSSYFVVGRLPVCDVALQHPSISKYHAVLQYRGQSGEEGSEGEEKGFYVYDLGSTHGTVVNKNKIPPKTYIRLHVGHVLKFAGSTRLFILLGPASDEEEELELTVTELRERSRKQRAELEKRMMGEDSDDDDKEEEEEEGGNTNQGKGKKGDSGCSWGMAEEAAPEDDEDEENPFATEFQEDQEAAYLKDPKKALQGFYDREGEELEFEYEDKNHGSWLCRIKLPVDDAAGKQLVAEVTLAGKKKDAAVQCCLEACRILEARGLLRQEAVSRKRKKKNWEDEDYYGSDDDTFLDRTGAVEKKRKERMKKAGKITERPETYDSLVAKLAGVQEELSESLKTLNSGWKDPSGSSTEDPLDAFMSSVRSQASMDAVARRKLHMHVADLRKEVQRLQKLVELTRPAQLPSLQPSSSDPQKTKKTLPMFGAMKGGNKFKLKTGTIGKLPPKRANLPADLFDMKGLPQGGEVEEEEEEEDEEKQHALKLQESGGNDSDAASPTHTEPQAGACSPHSEEHSDMLKVMEERRPSPSPKKAPSSSSAPSSGEGGESVVPAGPKRGGRKRAQGPSRPPMTGTYPEDDPDYCVWVPPSGQTGDGRTHLNERFGY